MAESTQAAVSVQSGRHRSDRTPIFSADIVATMSVSPKLIHIVKKDSTSRALKLWANMNTRNYRLEKGWRFRRFDWKVRAIHPLHPIVRALSANLDRVSSIMYLMPSLAHWTQFDQHAVETAFLTIFGTLEPTKEQLRSPGTQMKIWEIQSKLQAPLIDTSDTDMRWINNRTAIVASQYLPQLFHRFGDWLGPGVESVLATGVSGAWTAFEVLAKDLWTQAVNLRPETLTLATLKAKSKLDMLERYQSEAKESGKQTSVWLQEKCEIHFNGTTGIRSAYEATFGDSTKRLFSRKRFRRMEVVQSVRNLMVHQAGIVDDKFVRTAVNKQELFGGFATLKAGQPLPLDGELVRRFAGTTSFCSAALVTVVNRWLEAHPI